MKITILTASTGRPRQFALLEKYMSRQTFQPYQWVVVGENYSGYSFTKGQDVIRRDPTHDKPGSISLVQNYLKALDYVRGTHCLGMEDDDWFSPGYIETMAREAKANLWGSAPAFYWHVGSRRWRNMKNAAHCSFTQTGFTPAVFPALKTCATLGTPYLDSTIWVHWPNTLERDSYIFPNVEAKPLMVGLKGIPWGCTKGAGLGHDPLTGIRDNSLGVLKRWIGNDWKNYYDKSGKILLDSSK